jgi:hypothetical protein
MNEHQHDSEYQRLRKLLKELPKMDASPDFEMKLQRRIHQESEDKFRFLDSIRRIPVFAYSLVTILLVGGISYYAFFKHGSIPSQEQLPPDHVVIPLPEKSAAVSADTVKEKRAAALDVTKDASAREADKKLSTQSLPSREEGRANVREKTDAVQRSMPLKNIDHPETKQEERPSNEMMIHEGNAAAKEMVVPAPKMMMKKTENEMNRAAGEIVQPNFQSVTDSTAHADSLKKLDSLRRAQKQHLIDKNRRKISKPKG